MQIKGTGASPGIAIGKAFVLPAWEWEMSDEEIDTGDLAAEFERLYEGIRSSKLELTHIKEELSEVIGNEESNIFDAHLAILEDPVFMNEVQGIIRRQYKAAEVAVKETIEKFAGMFDLLEDEYMRERAMDIKDVGNRLIKHLVGAPEVTLPEDNQPFILVAKELAPSQLAHLNPQHVQGIVTMVGGKTSHSAIMARAMGIPMAIVAEGKLTHPIQTGDMVAIDGNSGIVHLQPSDETISDFQSMKQEWRQYNERLQAIATVPAVTRDGKGVKLEANMNTVKELDQVVQNGIHGVGLLRTEFLYIDRDSMPSEDEQFAVYRLAAERLEGRPLSIRTLDIGGDKKLNYLPLAAEENPFLGYRAIRICLDYPDLFKAQLRAILRASHYGYVRLMYPMITSLGELRRANAWLEECKHDLSAKGIPYNENIEVGVMIEVPAAAMIADLLAKEVDFFSIGTNDLIQYLLAVDRMNETIAPMYDPYHPAVIRTLKRIADAAHEARIRISVCGELAGDPQAIPIWLALDIEELSMSVHSILPVKQKILESDKSQCRQIFEDILGCDSGEDIRQLLKKTHCGITG